MPACSRLCCCCMLLLAVSSEALAFCKPKKRIFCYVLWSGGSIIWCISPDNICSCSHQSSGTAFHYSSVFPVSITTIIFNIYADAVLVRWTLQVPYCTLQFPCNHDTFWSQILLLHTQESYSQAFLEQSASPLLYFRCTEMCLR